MCASPRDRLPRTRPALRPKGQSKGHDRPLYAGVVGRDDLDLYGSAASPSRGGGVARGLARVLGVLVGGAISLYGVALYALRCFDTCPSDPSVDMNIQLLSAALVLFGLVVAIAAASAWTRWAVGAMAVVACLGAVITVAGAVALALVPSIEQPHGDRGSAGLAAAVALAVGAAVTAAALVRRKKASPPRD